MKASLDTRHLPRIPRSDCSHLRHRFERLTLVTTALALVVFVSCRDRASETAAPAAPEATAATAAPAAGALHTYNVKGRVTRLPQPGDARREITIAHEAIPEFASPGGNRIGMAAMTMPFEVAPELALDGIAPGDPVRFTLTMRWREDPPARITAVEELPPDEPLALAGEAAGEAAPAAPPPP